MVVPLTTTATVVLPCGTEKVPGAPVQQARHPAHRDSARPPQQPAAGLPEHAAFVSRREGRELRLVLSSSPGAGARWR